MALFKKVPAFNDTVEFPVDGDIAATIFSAVTPEYLVTWFWPAMIGLVIAFWLSLIDFRDASRVVAAVTCIAQALVMAAAA